MKVPIQALRSLSAVLLASLLWSPAPAQTQLLLDGDFDSLTVGTAPDRGTPNGAWAFPDSYGSTSAGDQREPRRRPETYSIVETSSFDATRTGLSLKIDYPRNTESGVLVNMLSDKVTEADGGIVRVKFDTFVPQGDNRTGGAIVFLGSNPVGFGGISYWTDQGPLVGWRANDRLVYLECVNFRTSCDPGSNPGSDQVTRTALQDYPRDVWQHVQLDIDLAKDKYDLYHSAADDPLELLKSELGFSSGKQLELDRLLISGGWFSGENSVTYFDNVSVTWVPPVFDGVPLHVGETYLQDFDAALGADGAVKGQTLPTGWFGSPNGRGFSSATTAAFPEDGGLGRGLLLYNAGGVGDADRALAIGMARSTNEGFLQLVTEVAGSSANAFQLAFDVEAWDAGRVNSLGEAAFDVTLDVNTGDGFVPLVELGRVTTGATLFPPPGDHLDGNAASNRVTFDSGLRNAAIPADSQLRIRWSAASDAAIQSWVFGLDNVSFSLFGDAAVTPLLAGDADQDLDFDQLDLVKVQIANKYLTGQQASWGDGDWNSSPGGSPGNPPPGDGLFNQMDIIAAQQADAYLAGPYAAIVPGGERGDSQTSVVYDPSTGEVAVDAPSGTEVTSINIDSAAGIFTGQAAQNLGGSFDNDADANIFKATFGSSFGSLSFGNVARAGLSEQFVLGDLSVVGSLAGGGDLGSIDLVYVPEPTSALLLAIGLVIGLSHVRRKTCRV